MPANRRSEMVPTTIRLPRDLYDELRILMCDPRTGAIRYATWGRLFESLARDYLDRQKISVANINGEDAVP